MEASREKAGSRLTRPTASPAPDEGASRWLIFVALLVVTGVGVYLAMLSTRLYLVKQGFSGSFSYNLWWKSYPWAVLLAMGLGILAGSYKQPERTRIVNNEMLRHEAGGSFLEHWAAALSGIVLLVSGLALGPLSMDRWVQTATEVGSMLNVHFAGTFVFLFGIAYHLTNHLLAKDASAIWPKGSDVGDAIKHYTAPKGSKPREGKFLASEKLAYLGWTVLVGGLVLTGLIKQLAYVSSLSAGLMGAVTFLHDLLAIGMGLFLIVHLVAVLFSWQLLVSMFTGYVSADYARENHPQWYEETVEAPEVRSDSE